MEKQFIPYEEARLLKGLGFDEKCFRFYREETNYDRLRLMGGNGTPKTNSQLIDLSYTVLKGLQGKVFMTAPLYQQAFAWFREKHELKHTINDHCGEKFYYNITNLNNTSDYELKRFCVEEEVKVDDWSKIEFKTYEEAEQMALEMLIKFVKTK